MTFGGIAHEKRREEREKKDTYNVLINERSGQNLLEGYEDAVTGVECSLVVGYGITAIMAVLTESLRGEKSSNLLTMLPGMCAIV